MMLNYYLDGGLLSYINLYLYELLAFPPNSYRGVHDFLFGLRQVCVCAGCGVGVGGRWIMYRQYHIYIPGNLLNSLSLVILFFVN